MAEVVLDRGKCLYLRRPIAFSGTLVVTNRRVQFEPSTLDRAVGAKPWECAVNRIDKIEFTRVTRVMLIYTGSTVRRLLGKEVDHLYERLSSLVPKSDPNEAAFQFEPGERVLLRERVLKVVNRFFWTSGHLTLTDRRIRFQPQRGLDRWLWKNQSVDAQLDAAQEFMAESSYTMDAVWAPDGTKTKKEWTVKGIPSTFIIDVDGLVKHHYQGYSREAGEQIHAEVLDLLH